MGFAKKYFVKYIRLFSALPVVRCRKKARILPGPDAADVRRQISFFLKLKYRFAL